MQRYLDTADTLIVALDRTGTVTMLNRYGLELLGYGEHEIIGRNWFKTVLPQPAGREDVYPVFQAIMRGEMEQTAYHENEILTASGARRLIAWRNTFLRDELGNPMGTLSTGMDLTNHREIERRNQRLQKAESLRRMAGAIAHHFNNQLHTVMGNIEMAGLDLPKGCQAAQALGEAMKAAGRAGDLSAAMLIYLGQSFSERTIHDLSVLCHRSLDRLRACLPAAVTLRADLPDPGPRVSVDADQISLLLDHLVQNAIEAIGPVPGTIRVRIQTWAAEEIPALERFPGDWQPTAPRYVGLSVSDDGCGIAAGDLERLFDPFFTSKLTGRGLGLPESLGVALAHSGAILVQSQPGQGSVFRLILPQVST
jgi:PAS domain S-box-containing protein